MLLVLNMASIPILLVETVVPAHHAYHASHLSDKQSTERAYSSCSLAPFARPLAGMIPYASHRCKPRNERRRCELGLNGRCCRRRPRRRPCRPPEPLPLKRVCCRLASLPSFCRRARRLCRRCRRRRLRLCSSSWVRNQAAWEHFRELTRPPVDRRSVAEKQRRRDGERYGRRKRELGAFS